MTELEKRRYIKFYTEKTEQYLLMFNQGRILELTLLTVSKESSNLVEAFERDEPKHDAFICNMTHNEKFKVQGSAREEGLLAHRADKVEMSECNEGKVYKTIKSTRCTNITLVTSGNEIIFFYRRLELKFSNYFLSEDTYVLFLRQFTKTEPKTVLLLDTYLSSS